LIRNEERKHSIRDLLVPVIMENFEEWGARVVWVIRADLVQVQQDLDFSIAGTTALDEDGFAVGEAGGVD
jgi:hypothetical protein